MNSKLSKDDDKKRITIDRVSNGWLVRISQADQLISRHVFVDLASLLTFLKGELT